MNILTLLEGDTGDGKTTTLYTSRGDIAHIDIDNQAYLSVGRFPWLSTVAEMLKPFANLAAGYPAIWHTVNPLDFTPERIEAFAQAAGLGRGDTLGIDPLSEYFGTLMDANEYNEVTRGGGERINWRKLKVPYKALLRCLNNLPCDVVVTRRLGYEYDANGVPTDKLRPEGEKAKTRYEFPFVWRLSDRGGQVVATFMKKKGGFFTYGQEFVSAPGKPLLLREIYEQAGVYAALDSIRRPMKADENAAVIEASEMFGNTSIVMAELLEGIEDAAAAGNGALDKFLKHPATVAKCEPLSAADKAKLRAAFEAAKRR